MLETLDHTIRIGSTPTFLYFDKIKLIGHFDRRPTGRYFEPWGWSCGFWGRPTWQGGKAMILILSSSDENNILYRAQRMSKILFSPREVKIYIFKLRCNFLFNI